MNSDLFARYLDLDRLRGRRRGLVRCIFHPDRTASLSVDLDAGVFNCFACGAQGGMKAFADRVGEQPDQPMPRRESTPPKYSARWMAPGVMDMYLVSERIRERDDLVARARTEATADTDAAWDLLEKAAALETETRAIEAEQDEINAETRRPGWRS